MIGGRGGTSSAEAKCVRESKLLKSDVHPDMNSSMEIGVARVEFVESVGGVGQERLNSMKRKGWCYFERCGGSLT